MPSSCCIRGCKSKGSGFEYYRFPKDEALKVKWVQAIRQNNGESFEATVNSKICNAHFTEDDFQQMSELQIIAHRAEPSVVNRPRIVQNIKRKRSATDLNPVESYDYLSEHNYVQKLPDVPSPDFDDIGSEVTIDPSTCMVQTLKVGKHVIHDPCEVDLTTPTEISDENHIIDLTADSDDSSDNSDRLDNNFYKNWQSVITSNTNTIRNLKKKVKVLQQKVKRQELKICNLESSLENYYCN